MAGSKVTTFLYDLAGNRTAMLGSGDSTYYAWDAAGQMITAEPTAGTVSFTYNADGQRVVKQDTDGSATGFLYDFARLLHETDEVGGEISNTYAVSTQDEFGDLLSEDGEQLTHQYDAMANTNALLDDSGVLQANYKYYAFGQVASFSVEGDYWASLTVDQWWNMTVDQWWGLPAQLTTHMLAGGRKQYYLDPDTQLYLLGGGVNGRYYDPSTARFLSEDPIRQQSGDVNLFAYVQDNPINRLDPSGHDPNEATRKAEMERQREQRTPSDTKPPAAATASKAAEAPATTQKQSPPPPAPAQGAVQQQSAEDKAKAAATRPQNSNPTGGATNTSQPRQLNQSPNPGPLRLARALAAVGVDVPDKVAKDPQFAAAMNQAEKYYQQYKTDPRAKNFINADEYVAMHLSLESKGMVSAWLRDNAAGTLSTQSAEGLNRRLANKQSYDEWAKYNTGWRGFFKDQISIAKAEAYGAKGGLSIATNTFTFHLSDKWHVTNSQQYQGADFTASRVFATVSREAFIFAATAGTAQLARGGVEGLSISARVINTLAESQRAVQAAGVVTKGLAAADLAKGTYEAGGGIHEVIKNPTDYHGYVDVGVGTLQVFGGTQSLRELGAATKTASNAGKAVEAVGQEAKQLEKAAATVAKEAGSGEKAVAAAAHESGQAAKETGDATKEVSHATHELSQADKAVAATSKEGTGAANAARQVEKNVAAPADQAVAESKEVASHTARQSEKALGEVKEASTVEQGAAKAEQTATEAVKHNVGVGAQQEEAAAHVAQAGGQAASKTEQTVTKTVKEGEGVVEQIEKETVQSAKQAERAAAERAGATQGERSAGRAAEEKIDGEVSVKKSGEWPATGVAKFDKLALESPAWKRWAANLEKRGVKLVPKPLEEGTKAEYYFGTKTLVYDPRKFTYIDMLHESRHIRQFEIAAARNLDVEKVTRRVSAWLEKGALDYEARLGKRFGFSSEYMNKLRDVLRSKWTSGMATKYEKSASFREMLSQWWQ